MNDLKFAVRQLLKNPGFTVHLPQCCYGGRAVAVLTLALGIGANTAMTCPESGGANCQGLVDGDLGMLTVKPQDFRSVKNFNAHQVVGAAVVKKDPVVNLDSRHFAALLAQVNVSRVHFGIVSDLHTLSSKVKGQHRHDHKAIRFLSHDRHDLFRAVVFAFPCALVAQVQTESNLSLPCWHLTPAPDRVFDLWTGRSTFDHALQHMMTKVNRFHCPALDSFSAHGGRRECRDQD